MNTVHPMPWLEKIWHQLTAYKKNKRLPNALLLYGQACSGKSTFINQYAKYILCQQATDQACLTCRSCQLFDCGNHPDYFLIQSEDNNIKIDSVRNLTEDVAKTSILGGYQVVLINKAEEMNRAAANALLKTLEEPRGDVFIILLSNNLNAVVATVRSRCQLIKFPMPLIDEAITWLQEQQPAAISFLPLTDNNPLRALTFANQKPDMSQDELLALLIDVFKNALDPTKAAAQCLKEPRLNLEILSLLVMELIRVKLASHGSMLSQNKLMQLQPLINKVTVKQLFYFLDKLYEATRFLAHKTNVNLQLLFEQIFIRWRYCHEFS